MVCAACLAIPFAFAGGGGIATKNKKWVITGSIVLTIAMIVFIYFKYIKKCTTCK